MERPSRGVLPHFEGDINGLCTALNPRHTYSGAILHEKGRKSLDYALQSYTDIIAAAGICRVYYSRITRNYTLRFLRRVRGLSLISLCYNILTPVFCLSHYIRFVLPPIHTTAGQCPAVFFGRIIRRLFGTKHALPHLESTHTESPDAEKCVCVTRRETAA